MRTFGVEEELLLVDERTGAPVAAAPRALARGGSDADTDLEGELQQEMIEVVGRPCTTLEELAAGIRDGRLHADAAARSAGARAVALATSPVAAEPHGSPSKRHSEILRRFGPTASRCLTCGFHVHVSVESAEEGVAVLDRVREWLPVVLALSANSPICDGVDTGYESYRTEVWNRWPSAGPNPLFGSEAGYRAHEAKLLATGALLDAGMLYFDARLSRAHPTVELRVADVCLLEEDAVTIAALCRGLVEVAAAGWRAGVPPLGADERLLRLANWRAALVGVRGHLVHPVTGAPCSPQQAAEALVGFARPGLEVTGDRDRVERGVASILARGTGADRQRERFVSGGSAADVVRSVLQRDAIAA
jgi:carboxylate-amine ligase